MSADLNLSRALSALTAATVALLQQDTYQTRARAMDCICRAQVLLNTCTDPAAISPWAAVGLVQEHGLAAGHCVHVHADGSVSVGTDGASTTPQNWGSVVAIYHPALAEEAWDCLLFVSELGQLHQVRQVAGERYPPLQGGV